MRSLVKALVPLAIAGATLASGTAASASISAADARGAGSGRLVEVGLVEVDSLQAAESGTVTPMNVVRGNCGKAWLWLSDAGRRKYKVRTGFELSGGRRAVAYSWRVQANGPRHWGKRHKWDGGLRLRKKWEGSRESNVPRGGNYSATVVAGAVALSNGRACAALPASDPARIT
ncbi:hypothetical protein ACGFNU_00565 [Spirillospora sp. NPDC048911]|uniref:hypothetical protein n=1 Tax=Spirillospora sp. NPDC048911 TaxID=3364527 RepID=UPI00371DD2AF